MLDVLCFRGATSQIGLLPLFGTITPFVEAETHRSCRRCAQARGGPGRCLLPTSIVSALPNTPGLHPGTAFVHAGVLAFEPATGGRPPALLDWEDGMVVLVGGAWPQQRPHPLLEGDVVQVELPADNPHVELHVDVSSDRMSAALGFERGPGTRYRLADAPPTDRLVLRRLVVERIPCPPPTGEQLLRALQERGVVHGIRADALERCRTHSGRPEQVAWGTRPADPVDSTIAFAERPQPTANAGLWSVEARRLLVTLTPAREGRDGRDVLGAVVPARPPRTVTTPENANVEAIGTGLYAAVDGFAVLDGAALRVEPSATVESLGASAGQIVAAGALTVHGTIGAGSRLRARGTLRVGGIVDQAELELLGSAFFG